MTRLRALTVLTLMFLLACGGPSAAPTAASAGSAGDELPAESEPVDAPAAAQAPTELELLNAGSEPRSQLRYHYTPGAASRTVVSMSMSTQSTVNDVRLPAPVLPLMRMVFVEGPYEALGGERFGTPARIVEVQAVDRPGVLPEVLVAVEEALAPLTDLVGHYVLDTRGNSISEQWAFRPGVVVSPAAEQMRQDMLADSKRSVPLPLEAVGVGARWQAKELRRDGGMLMRQTITFTLVSRDGDVVEIEGVVTQTAEPQDITMDNGMQARLLALSGSGRANSTLNLSSLTLTSEISITTEVDMLVENSRVHSAVTLELELSQGPTNAPRP